MKSTPARLLLPAVVVGLVWTGLVMAGEETRLGAQQAPGREMTLDFLALTADGAPIPNLKAEDLTLRVGGRPRTIKGIKLVSFGAATPAPAATPEAKPSGPAPPFGTNVGAAGGGGGADSGSRAYLFLVDTESILPNVEKRLRDSIDKVVGTLTPRDRVGLVVVPRPTLNVPLSMNHAAFRTALGQVASAGAGASNAGCRTRDVLDMIRNIVSALNPADGPYNVVLMSESLSVSATGTCEVTNSDYQRVPSVLAASRARLYVVHATETVAGRNDGLETLAGVTGAGAVIRLATGDNPLARIPRETAMHYIVTFEVEPAERTGQLSRVELRTARQGATIRATNEIAMSKADATAAPGAAMATDLAGMLKSSAAFTALPLRGAALFPTRTEGTGIRILAMLEAVEPGTKFSGAGAGLFDSNNKMVTTAKAADEKQLAAGSIIVPLEAPAPGTYKVRFVATDDKGRSGAVEHTVDTNFAALGPLKFSGIFVGAPGTAGCGPKLAFSTEEAICAVVEMYGQPTAQMSATLEILPAAGGKAIQSVGMAGAATSQPDRFNLSAAQVPIAALAPGDYIVRAVIGMQGHPDAIVERTLRKVGK